MPTRAGVPAGVLGSLLIPVALLPVLLLSLYAYCVTSDSVRGLVQANNQSAAQMAAELVRGELDNTIDLAKALTVMPRMIEAVGNRDEATVRQRLQAMVQTFPAVDRAFVLDLQGVLWADYPVAPESLGHNFAHRDYFRGLSRHWQPCISEVFQRQAEPKPRVVAVAVAIRGPDQKVLGVLVFQHRLEEVARWGQQLRIGSGGHVVVLDHNGTVVAHPGLDLQSRSFADYADLAPVRAAMGGRGGDTVEYDDPLDQQTMVASFVPVPVADHQRWVVIAQQPVDEAYAPIRRLGLGLGAVTAVLALSALAVVLRLSSIGRQLQRTNQTLVAEIAEHERTEEQLLASEKRVQKEQQTLKQLLEVYERDRQLVSYEIHDGLAQPLTAALMNLEALQVRAALEAAAGDGCAMAITLVRDSLAQARSLMRGLRPVILDDFGVVTAVDHLVSESQTNGDVQIEWSHDVEFDRLAPPLEITLYRVVQEGLTNALRHSQSKRIRVALVQQGDRILARVEDWGQGFDLQAVGADRFGLRGLRERVELLGGQAAIDSTPGKGTRITVELPVVRPSPDATDGDE